jgi:hypothetical protein
MSTNGHDSNTTRMVELLEQIVAEAKATSARLDRVEGRIAKLEAAVFRPTGTG